MRNLSIEKIQSKIEYIKGKNGLQGIVDSINYYNEVGAKKSLDWYEEQKEAYLQEISSLENLLSKGFEKIYTTKVRVTEYSGNIVIETIDPGKFDQDFSGPVLGSIGCSLYDTSRLEMSKEAVDAIKKLNRVGDSIGDFMSADSDYFTWIGGEFSIKDSNSVLSRDFKIPVGYVKIENITSDKARREIDQNNNALNSVEYKDLKHEIWIEISQHSYWGPTDDDSTRHEYKHSDFHTVEVKIHNKYIDDADLKILNAPDGCVYPKEMYRGDKFGREYKLTNEEYKEIVGLSNACFSGMEGEYKGSYGWTTSGFVIPQDQVMSFVNGLFAIGFDNNIMNPRMNYWRMSLEATTLEIKQALKSFKRA